MYARLIQRQQTTDYRDDRIICNEAVGRGKNGSRRVQTPEVTFKDTAGYNKEDKPGEVKSIEVILTRKGEKPRKGKKEKIAIIVRIVCTKEEEALILIRAIIEKVANRERANGSTESKRKGKADRVEKGKRSA